MYTVLLSGGSGKRLWPLSNDLRSKQYIKIFENEENGEEQVSMVQRVIGQLERAGLKQNTLICAGKSQVEIIHSQLGDIGIAVEPERRNTFPAVAISCAYAVSKLGASEDEVMAVLPVDPYTDDSYFATLSRLGDHLLASGADIALMGAIPDAPSEKYGYILPAEDRGEYFTVGAFREKPDLATAADLIAQGAVFNCGVFCFKIGLICDILRQMDVQPDYDYLYEHYELLPKISFDYQVLEKASNMIAVPFRGVWKDLGTWNALTEEMHYDHLGYVISDRCENVRTINELDIPIITCGLKDVVVAAGADGILVADRQQSEYLKASVEKLTLPPMYEERRWGTLKTVDRDDNHLTRHVKMFAGMVSSCHYHQQRDEVWVFLKGSGEMIVGECKMTVGVGTSVSIPKGVNHMIKAITDLEFLEVHLGASESEDIHRLSFDWDEISKTI